MREVERLADQLRRAYEGPAWHGPSVCEVLEGVTHGLAASRPVAAAHDPWEIVLHVAAWKDMARRAVAGETWTPSEAEDWPAVADASPLAWEAANARLARAHGELLAAVLGLADADLERRVPGRSQPYYTYYFLLHGVAQHDLYHAGQIALLRK